MAGGVVLITVELVVDFMDSDNLSYANGDQYVGEQKNEEPHGQGTYTYANDDQYVGEFNDGTMHGQGKYTYSDGEFYVGEFKNSSKHGHGTLIYPSGDKYIGEFKDDIIEGNGKFIMTNGAVHEGEYKNGMPNGHGVLISPDGSKYVGDFKNRNPNGQGVLNLANGDKYIGDFKNGLMHGQGVYTSAKGSTYSGDFKEGSIVNSNNKSDNRSLTLTVTTKKVDNSPKSKSNTGYSFAEIGATMSGLYWRHNHDKNVEEFIKINAGGSYERLTYARKFNLTMGGGEDSLGKLTETKTGKFYYMFDQPSATNYLTYLKNLGRNLEFFSGNEEELYSDCTTVRVTDGPGGRKYYRLTRLIFKGINDVREFDRSDIARFTNRVLYEGSCSKLHDSDHNYYIAVDSIDIKPNLFPDIYKN